tara:strand:+ start:86 stop:784 length:699 start_codon:yes stop_codon:yes gene_type:complete
MLRLLLSLVLFAPSLYAEMPAFDYPDSKRWLHRANTVDKARGGLERYPGIEVDVVYYQGVDRFDVRHRFFAMPSGLTLDRLLAELDGQPRVWVDFKNATWWNAPFAARRLVVLAQRHGLAGRILVEAKNARISARMSAEGVPVSLWLQDLDAESTPDRLLQRVGDIRAALDRYEIGIVSAPHRYAPLLAEHFTDFRAHVWTNGLKLPRDEEAVAELEALANVRIILVDERPN